LHAVETKFTVCVMRGGNVSGKGLIARCKKQAAEIKSSAKISGGRNSTGF
jgi:hypothetical protein